MGRTINMSDDEYAMNEGDAGASLTVSVEAGQIRKGGYIMIKGKACKVKDVSVSKTGKHGHAKCKFAASDIFSGATCEELQLPNVAFSTDDDANVSKLIKEYCALVDEGANIEIYCTVQAAIGLEKIIDVRKKDA